jgi:hypothetical protein
MQQSETTTKESLPPPMEQGQQILDHRREIVASAEETCLIMTPNAK